MTSTPHAKADTRNRLLAIFAHPDDESFGPGGTIAKYASKGVEVTLIVATRGEKSTLGESSQYSVAELGEMREGELRCAAQVLGIKEIRALGYRDTQVAQIDTQELRAVFSEAIAEVQPDVVLTFDPRGITGNPDHMAVTKAVSLAFSDVYGLATRGQRPQNRLYYWTIPEAIARHLRDLSNIPFVGASDESITTVIDVSDFKERQWQAIACHQSQSNPVPLVLKERLYAQKGQESFVLHGVQKPGGAIGTDLFVD